MSLVDFLSQPLWQRLGLTLIHFLWQGVTVAVLVCVLVRAFSLKRGNTRHAAYLLAFAVMIACPAVTFIAVDTSSNPSFEFATEAESTKVVGSLSYTTLPAGDISPEADTSSPVTSAPAIANTIPLRERISGWLHVSMPWVLVIWMTGVILLSVRLLMGFIGVYRWRHYLEPLPERLPQRIASLSERLGLQDFSRIFISPSALQAVAVGYLRPMVLLPAAMVTQMPLEMLEAVIAHELAHIRRLDLWINLVQRIAETLLFYHPAVWWLSHCLRSERELCCDELAVKATGKRVTYASTLESLSRIRLMAKRPVLATALGQDNKPMLSRVRHILGFAPAQRNYPVWFAGLIAILFLIALAVPTTLALTQRVNSPARYVEAGADKVLADMNYKMAQGQFRTLEEQVELMERYLKTLPDSPRIVKVLNVLGTSYARVGRTEQAKQMLKHAIVLANGDRFVNTIKINLAYAQMEAGDLEEAENLLLDVVSLPVPKTLDDSYAVTPQLFSAPFFLAEVYQKKGDATGADKLLKQTANRALKMAKENPDVKLLPSYVSGAFQRRVNLILERNEPNKINKAYELAEELKNILPEETLGYQQMIYGIKYYEQRIHSKPAVRVEGGNEALNKVQTKEISSDSELVLEEIEVIFEKANQLQERQKQASREYLSSLSDRELAEVHKKAHVAQPPPKVSPNDTVLTDSYLGKIREKRQDIINELVERFVLDEEDRKHFNLEYQKIEEELAGLGVKAVPMLVEYVGGLDFVSEHQRGGLAKGALLKMGSSAVKVLIKLMSSEDKIVRAGSANILSKLGDPRANDALLRALDDETGNVRRHAFDGLVRLGPDVVGHDRLGTILIEHLEEHDMWKAIRGLGQYGDERAIESLQVIERFYPIRGIKGIKGDLRYSARRAINAILRRSGKVVEEVRWEDYSKKPPTCDELRAAAQCSNAAIRRLAILRLEHYRDDETTHFLIERMESENNPAVVDAIGRTISSVMTPAKDPSVSVVSSPEVVQKAFDAFISVTENIPALSSKYSSVKNPSDFLTQKERKLLTTAVTGGTAVLKAANKHQIPLKGIEEFKNIVLIWGLFSNDLELKVASYGAVITIAQLSPRTGKSWLQYQREHLQEQLAPLLESPSPNIRLIECLGYIGDTRLTPRFVELLQHETWSVRQFAAYALAEIGDPKALSALEHLAETDPHQYKSGEYGVRKAAAEAIERIQKQKISR